MNEDIKSNHEEGYCELCSSKLCSNCGKCCHCSKCDCKTCHPNEADNEPLIKEAALINEI